LENTKIITDDPSTGGILDFEKYSKFLANTIVNSKPRFAVGIFGDWGTGKTTLLMMIKQILEMNKKILTVWFDAWRYEREQYLAVIPFLRTIELALEDHIKRNETKWETVRNAIIRTANAFSESTKANIGITGIASAQIDFEKLVNSFKGDGTIGNDVDVIYYHATDFLNMALSQLRKSDSDYRIVIFIDDLDRCLPEKSLEVIESIKSFFDLEGIVYVLGMNSSSITSIIKQKYGDDPTITGFDFLKKIVQLPFLIPDWNESDLSKFIDDVIIKELRGSDNMVNAFRNDRLMIIKAAEKNPREMKRFANNIILAQSIFDKPLSNLIAVQALRFRPEWNKFLSFITDDGKRKTFFEEYKNLNTKTDESKKQFLEKYPAIAEGYKSLVYDTNDLLRIFLLEARAGEKLVEIENMNEYRRALDTVDVKTVSSTLTIKNKILNKWDRQILGTRYFESLCDLTFKNQGSRSKFSKDEIYNHASIGAYNSSIVIPLIIEKLKLLTYIREHEDNQISLTPLGKENCGNEVVLDETI